MLTERLTSVQLDHTIKRIFQSFRASTGTSNSAIGGNTYSKEQGMKIL